MLLHTRLFFFATTESALFARIGDGTWVSVPIHVSRRSVDIPAELAIAWATPDELNTWSDHESDPYVFDSDSTETPYSNFHGHNDSGIE